MKSLGISFEHSLLTTLSTTTSISKDIEVSAGSRGSTGELDQLSLALPALCGILDVCYDLKTKKKVPSGESAQSENSEGKARLDPIAALSSAACR